MILYDFQFCHMFDAYHINMYGIFIRTVQSGLPSVKSTKHVFETNSDEEIFQ